MNEDVPPDLVGQMATVGTTQLPLGMCPSCSRALIYGALTYAGAVQEDIQTAYIDVEAGMSHKGLARLQSAEARQSTLMSLLVQFVHADFEGSVSGGIPTDEDDFAEAIEAFLRSRMDTYVSDDGQILFEPHEDER